MKLTTGFSMLTNGFSEASCEDGVGAKASIGDTTIFDAIEVYDAEVVGGLTHATGPSL